MPKSRCRYLDRTAIDALPSSGSGEVEEVALGLGVSRATQNDFSI